jgi:hypothetical protein
MEIQVVVCSTKDIWSEGIPVFVAGIHSNPNRAGSALLQLYRIIRVMRWNGILWPVEGLHKCGWSLRDSLLLTKVYELFATIRNIRTIDKSVARDPTELWTAAQ